MRLFVAQKMLATKLVEADCVIKLQGSMVVLSDEKACHLQAATSLQDTVQPVFMLSLTSGPKNQSALFKSNAENQRSAKIVH